MKVTVNGRVRACIHWFNGDREVKETLAIPALTELLASRGDTNAMVGCVR